MGNRKRHPQKGRLFEWEKPVCHRWEAVLILASPLGEEGHEVAKGCYRVSIENDTLH